MEKEGNLEMPESRTLVISDLHLHAGLFDLDRVAGEKRAGIGSRSAAARVARILDEFPDVTACLQR